MDYALKTTQEGEKTLSSAAKALAPLLADERTNLIIAVACVIVSSGAGLLGPAIVARVIDTAMARGDYPLLLRYAGLLALVYLAALGTSYLQTIRMGTTGRNVLYKLRNALFTKLSTLPIAFFAQNRAGDLISRVNSDTDKINQFFAQALMQFFGAAFLITGAGILLLVLNWQLGLAALAPAAVILVITQLASPWVKRTNRAALDAQGALSGDISESLDNFKVIVAFGRTDYFKDKFDQANQKNFRSQIRAGISSGVFMPLYTLAGSAAGILVLSLGVWMIGQGQLTVGLLVGYLLYVTAFYNPLRQIATVWSSLQMAMAALDRVSEVLGLKPDLEPMPDAAPGGAGALLVFDHVGFSYPNGKEVLADVNLALERGKTYALVGPTGGGKTTTAMLMARLYDPSRGAVYLDGRDIRSLTADERAAKIGFILQEPFLFSGTVRDNITYGNETLRALDDAALGEHLKAKGLSEFVGRFNAGLATVVGGAGDTLSLGQKQLIAFLRAVLREPEILILDEATANIDTVTEQLLEDVLGRLPATTTQVIIAHRLNTIRDADNIFFVGGGALTEAGSMDHAMDMLLNTKRAS
ncbi:MAG TPA: ABC transporter ATP-binding protein [Hyphomonadaceae bacterium]|nr:ABC transporter ATP-binding protein [Hyphomonadaceae bacterium]